MVINTKLIKPKISQQDYQDAIKTLTQNIRQKMDGTIDGKMVNDWILNPQAQQNLCLMIDQITQYLNTLI